MISRSLARASRRNLSVSRSLEMTFSSLATMDLERFSSSFLWLSMSRWAISSSSRALSRAADFLARSSLILFAA